MSRLIKLTSSFALMMPLLMLYNCGGPQGHNLAPQASKETIKQAPKWFLEPPTASEYLYSTSTSTSRAMETAIQKAKNLAQTGLAQQLELKMGSLTKQFQEETGLEEDSELLNQFTLVTKAVTDETLIGAREDKRELVSERGIYRAYVLMSLPIGSANQLLMSKLSADNNIYTRFRSTEAFKELDKELDAFAKREKEGMQ